MPIRGTAFDIDQLIKDALAKTIAKHGKKTDRENYNNLIADLNASDNKNITTGLNAHTLQTSIAYKTRKALTKGFENDCLSFSNIYLDSLSQYVHGKNFKDQYGNCTGRLSLSPGNQQKSKAQKQVPSSAEYAFTPNTDNPQFRAILSDLADELAYNYFSNSFGDDEIRGIANCEHIFKEEYRERFEERWNSGKRIRNIMVVGAGAAFDAYTAIPQGAEFLESIKQIFADDLAAYQPAFDEELSNITAAENSGGRLLENYFKVLSKYLSPAKIQERIKDLVEFRYSVSHFNEIVAHMLKHAFLDVVVNFNFDETLDQAVREELGPENYHHVINDGSCVMLKQILVDGRLQSPVYIKPHGTYSYKSSQRMTDNEYSELPGDIRIMLEELVSGKCGTNEYFDRVNIIMVGFSASQADFNEILNLKLPEASVIYHLDLQPFPHATAFFENKPLPIFLEKRLAYRKAIEEIYRPLSTDHFNKFDDQSKNNTLTPSLGEVLSVLWRIQNDRFQAAYKPRSIARHEMISYLFYRPELGSKENFKEAYLKGRHFLFTHIEKSASFFTDRLMIEFFILLNRSNGMLDIVEVLKGCGGLYYQKYREITEENKTNERQPSVRTVYEFLHSFSKDDPDNPKALLRQAREFNRGANIFTLISEFDDSDLNDETFSQKLAAMMKKLEKSLKAMPNPDAYRLSRSQLDQMVDDFIRDIKFYLSNWYRGIAHPIRQSAKNPEHELVKFGRAVTLIYRLLKSEFVSSYFKVNLLYNYKRKVFNGKNFTGTSQIPDSDVLFNELFRLLRKSWGNRYFIIDPKPGNTSHDLWESFSRKKVIHTNLGRAAEFNHLLINTDWNVFLSITETGSPLTFFRHLQENLQANEAEQVLQKIRNSHFVIICSYESIKQLYPWRKDNEGKIELINAHRDEICGILPDGSAPLILPENLSVLVLPFNQHNHHPSIFLKPGHKLRESSSNTILTNENMRFQDEPLSPSFNYDALGSIYFYRRGLSNSIDPIYIGRGAGEHSKLSSDHIFRDQVRLLDIFVKHLNRAFKFELVKRKGSEDHWPKAQWLMEMQRNWESKITDEKGTVRDITTTEFLAELYKQFTKE